MEHDSGLSILFIIRIDEEFFKNSDIVLDKKREFNSQYVAAWAGPSNVIPSHTTSDISRQRKSIGDMLSSCRLDLEGNDTPKTIGERIYNSLGLSQFFDQLITFFEKGIISRDLLIITNETLFPWEWAFTQWPNEEYDDMFLSEIFNCSTSLIGQIDASFLSSLAIQLSPKLRYSLDPFESDYIIISNDNDGELSCVCDEKEFLQKHIESQGINSACIHTFEANEPQCDLNLRRYFKSNDIRRVQLIHVAGHMKQGGMRVGLGNLDASEVEQMMTVGQLRATSLVVLNCCNSGQVIDHYRLSENRNTQISLIESFLRAGAETVLVTFLPISDQCAFNFVQCFYEKIFSRDESGLLRSVSIADALRETRLEWREKRGGDSTGCAYVLFGSPNARLFTEAERRMSVAKESRQIVRHSLDGFEQVKRKAQERGIKEDTSK